MMIMPALSAPVFFMKNPRLKGSAGRYFLHLILLE